jgi:ubiquitin-like protein Pup
MMAERVQKQKSNSERPSEEVVSSEASTQRGEKLKAELDDLLDEIDDVLESNAEDFVKSYIQKGGE